MADGYRIQHNPREAPERKEVITQYGRVMTIGASEEGEGAKGRLGMSYQELGLIPNPGGENGPNPGGTMWKHNRNHADKPGESFHLEGTYIGKSIVIKGELSGSENVRVAGAVEGYVKLLEGSFTIEPEGRVHGDVEAQTIVVHGRVEGNLFGGKRIDLKGSAVLVGDIHTVRIAIEEGASLKGSVQVQKDIPTLQLKKAG